MTRRRTGHIATLDANRHRIYWRDDNGVQHSPTIRGTFREAEIQLALRTSSELPPDMTWSEFYAAFVEPGYSKLAEKTVHEYRRNWKVELEPRIGSTAVASANWQWACMVLTDISAPTVQRACGRLLKKMCNIAIRRELLAANPVQAIPYAPHRRRPKRLVTIDGVLDFMARIEGIKYEAILLAELGAGLRPEEADCLLWEDFSPYMLAGSRYCAIDVSKALVLVGSRRILKDTKNDPSSRTAICGEPFASRLLALAEGREGPICPARYRRGSSVNAAWFTSPQTITHNWKQWCGRHGIGYVTQENMRSSYSTIAGEAMCPDSVVSGNMGHTDGTTKGRNYQTVTMRAKCMCADMIADAIAETNIGA